MTKVIYASSHDSDMLYAVKQSFHDPFFYIDTGKSKHVLLDKREIGVFIKNNKLKSVKAAPLEPLIEKSQALKIKTDAKQKLALIVFKHFKIKKVLVPDSFPLALADFLRENKIQVKILSPFFPDRVCKTDKEVAFIKDNLNRTKRAFARIEEILKKSKISGKFVMHEGKYLTSEILKIEAEKTLLENGMIDVEGMIIASGEDTSMPHNTGSGKILANAPIICDIFPKSKGNNYFADMTRTYVKGKASPEFDRLYKAVKNAQEAGFAAIKSGVKGQAVHEAVSKSFLVDGFEVGEKGFVHGTGHGLGLQVHEAPAASKYYEGNLEVGHVLTVEPGLYYSGLGGARIEDVIVVMRDGYRNLTNYHKNYRII